MSRPTDWSPLGLSRDPVPGDPLAVSAEARRYSDTATGIRTAVVNLRRLNGSSLVSEAFQVAFERIEDVAKKLDSTESRVSGAAVALDQYWPRLEQAQLDSLKALQAAEQARGEKQRHDQAVAGLANAYNSSTDPEQRNYLKVQYDRETVSSWQASGAIAAAKRTIENAIITRDNAAAVAIHALDDADRGSPVKDKLWDKAVDWFEKNILPTLKSVVESIAEFAEKYGTIIDIVGGVLAVAALFVPGGALIVGLTMGALSLFLSGMKMANASFKFHDGKMTAEEYKVVKRQELMSMGASVLAMATLGVGAAGKAVTTVAKVTAKTVAKEVLKQGVKVGKGIIADQRAGAEREEARYQGEERLHQGRIQEEARIRQFILRQRQQGGAASGDYDRRQVAPCNAGGM